LADRSGNVGPTMKKAVLIAVIFLIFFQHSQAQIESAKGSIVGFPVSEWYELSVDSAILDRLESLDQPKDKPFQFAFPVRLSITPRNSGFCRKSGNETIWTVGIHSKSAKSLNVILQPFRIPEGAYFFVYDPRKEYVRGPFGSENNNSSGKLPVTPVPGEWLILEYHLPAGMQADGTIGISQVSHDFIGVFGKNDSKDDRFGLSQPCNVDISCPAGNDYYDQKRAVCRIIISGIELCTGVLVNNTNHENRAYVITAEHCISNSSDAAGSLFVFGYESPWCSGPDGHVYHSVSGSLLRSSNGNIDFSLVELTSFPPFTCHPYLAGWDVSGATPAKTVAIHHPQGDVKKISVDLDQPVTASYTDYTASGFWKILQWDSGTTQGGSSGCPLFDQNKRVVGLLTGGEAVCGASVNDYFAKLSVSYNLSPYLWMQLKGWIDPAVSNVLKYDGRDPYAPNLLTVDTLSNISSAEERQITPFSGGTGYSTGYNSDSLVMYAEYFKNPLSKQLSEILINVARVNSVSPADSASLWVFADGSTPGAVLAHQKILFSEAKDTFVTKVDFRTTIPVGGNFYVGWKIYYHASAPDETRQLAVFHSPDRYDVSMNTAWFSDGASWKAFPGHPFSPMSVSLDVKAVVVGNPVPDAIIGNRETAPHFTVFPNPSDGRFYISTDNSFREVQVLVYDFSGHLRCSGNLSGRFPGRTELDISDQDKGLFYILINTEAGKEYHKVVVTN